MSFFKVICKKTACVVSYFQTGSMAKKLSKTFQVYHLLPGNDILMKSNAHGPPGERCPEKQKNVI